MPSDKMTGTTMLVGFSSAFFYYTFWVMIMPFVDADHVLQTYFPDRTVALVVPFLAAWTVLCLTTAYMGVVMMTSRAK